MAAYLQHELEAEAQEETLKLAKRAEERRTRCDLTTFPMRTGTICKLKPYRKIRHPASSTMASLGAELDANASLSRAARQ